jgi:hypothetical protein
MKSGCCDKNNRFATFYCFFRETTFPTQADNRIDLIFHMKNGCTRGKDGMDVSVKEERMLKIKTG